MNNLIDINDFIVIDFETLKTEREREKLLKELFYYYYKRISCVLTSNMQMRFSDN